MIVNPKSGRKQRLRGILERKYASLVAQLGPRLTPMQATLNEIFGRGRIHTVGWIPGQDWSTSHGGVFQPIYEVCRVRAQTHDEAHDEAARCYGLIAWMVFQEHARAWASGHGMKDGREIRSRTYWLWE